MLCTASLPLLQVSLWPGEVAPDRVLSLCVIELTVYKQMSDIKLWLSYKNTWNHLTVCRKEYIYIYIYIYIGHYWRSKDKLISDVLLWTPSHRHASVGRLTKTYLQHLCTDTGFRLEDLLEAMDDRDEWWESQGNLW